MLTKIDATQQKLNRETSRSVPAPSPSPDPAPAPAPVPAPDQAPDIVAKTKKIYIIKSVNG